jgi:hypothetical protein
LFFNGDTFYFFNKHNSQAVMMTWLAQSSTKPSPGTRGLAGSAGPGKCVSGAGAPMFLFRDARQPLPSPDTHPCFRDDLARLRPRRTPFASDHVARAVCACAPRHFRPAHWKRRRRRQRRRRGGRGEEGAAREARRGGALQAPWDLGRPAPPRPGVAGSPGLSGERQGRCLHGVRTWRPPPHLPGNRRPRSRGSLWGRSLLLSCAGQPPQTAPVSLPATCPAHIPVVLMQWLCASPGPVCGQAGHAGGRKYRTLLTKAAQILGWSSEIKWSSLWTPCFKHRAGSSKGPQWVEISWWISGECPGRLDSDVTGVQREPGPSGEGVWVWVHLGNI